MEMLAIVDEYYLSSTGKMIELAAAPRDRPLFVFPAEAQAARQLRQMQRLQSAKMLSDDPARAYQQVVGFMDGRILVALTAQQFQVLVNGLVSADLSNVSQLNVINITGPGHGGTGPRLQL